MTRVTRIEPALPARAFQSYQILAPTPTHWRRATCEEVDCVNYRCGWSSLIDTNTQLGKQQAEYIRRQSGRKFVAEKMPELGFIKFTFEAGQICFSEHKARIDKPEIYLLRQGDSRTRATGGIHRFDRADQWLDNFSSHQDRLKTLRERG